MERKFKDNENSRLLVQLIIREGTDQFGRHVIETKWIEAKEPVSLGSINNPNKKIRQIKWEVPEEVKDDSVLSRLFGFGD